MKQACTGHPLRLWGGPSVRSALKARRKINMNRLAQWSHQAHLARGTVPRPTIPRTSSYQQGQCNSRSYYPSNLTHQEADLLKNTDPGTKSTEKVAPTHRFTVSQSEVDHFNKLGSTWWNEYGGFGLLHKMNPVRVQFIKDRLLDDQLIPNLQEKTYHYPPAEEITQPTSNSNKFNFLDQKKVLDVGCGGGIFSEVLARLGARVLGIDAAEDSIKAAQQHAQLDPHFDYLNSQSQLDSPLAYRHCSVEDLLEADNLVHYGRYDLVCAMEVIEHVENPTRFLTALAELTKPGGQIILSTISRTPISRLLTITLAESNLPLIGLVPPGTHTYEKFIKPEELTKFFRDKLGWANSFERYDLEMRGCMFDPFAAKWKLFPRDALWGGWCNYFFAVRKPL